MKAGALARSVFKERFTIWICRGICKVSVDEAPKAEQGITFSYLKADWTLAILLHVLQSLAQRRYDLAGERAAFPFWK